MKPQNALEKRKWQVALRRYVLERQPSLEYAGYFGIDIPGFRSWIENQFTPETSWDNFGKNWQLEHVVPLFYFNLALESDLRLCWHFTNIQVGPVAGIQIPNISILQAQAYFQSLASAGLKAVENMVLRLGEISSQNKLPINSRLNFLLQSAERFKELEKLNRDELYRVNKGVNLNELMAEKKLFSRFN